MKQDISVEERWRMLVVEGRTTADIERMAHVYSLLPANNRCRICKIPFSGVSGQIMRALGKTQSSVNIHLCNNCDTFFRMNPGGVEVDLTMLFADIRGSTSLAEDMQPAEFRRLINRFYLSATDVLCESNALIDKLAGDQVSAYFVPGLVGQDHASQALQAARDLLLATGHDEPGGPWIPVGIGVHTGVAFIGSVGARGGLVDVTALGDAVNITARMASLAGPGQILASEETLSAAEIDPTGRESRSIALKGRSQPVNIYTL